MSKWWQTVLVILAYGLFVGSVSFLIAITLGHGWQWGFMPVAWAGGVVLGIGFARRKIARQYTRPGGGWN